MNARNRGGEKVHRTGDSVLVGQANGGLKTGGSWQAGGRDSIRYCRNSRPSWSCIAVGTLQRRWRICPSRVSRLGQSIRGDLGRPRYSPISDRRYVCGFDVNPVSTLVSISGLSESGSPVSGVGYVQQGRHEPAWNTGTNLQQLLLRTLFDALGNLVLRHRLGQVTICCKEPHVQ